MISTDSEDISVNDNQFTGYSYSKVYSTNYIWKINQITRLAEFCREPNATTIINSSEFSTGAEIADPWYLEFTYSQNSTQSNATPHFIYVIPPPIIQGKATSCTINLIRKNVKPVLRIRYKLFIVNNKNQKIQDISKGESSTRWRKEISNSSRCRGSLNIELEKLVDKKEEFLKNDTLTVGVELIVYDKYKSVNNPINLLAGSKRKLLNEDFKDLFLGNKKLKKDVVVKVGEKIFEAHKFVLTLRSSVFEAMFTHDLEEKKNNEINLPDVDPLVFEKVLEFIYTDTVDLKGCAEKLLEASDKYDLQGLKQMCQEFIYKNISIENALEVMVTNYLQDNKELKELAAEFIATNSMEFKNTQEFKDLKKSYPSLYFEVLEKILEIGK